MAPGSTNILMTTPSSTAPAKSDRCSRVTEGDSPCTPPQSNWLSNDLDRLIEVSPVQTSICSPSSQNLAVALSGSGKSSLVTNPLVRKKPGQSCRFVPAVRPGVSIQLRCGISVSSSRFPKKENRLFIFKHKGRCALPDAHVCPARVFTGNGKYCSRMRIRQ